jgi:hypothetical protein
MTSVTGRPLSTASAMLTEHRDAVLLAPRDVVARPVDGHLGDAAPAGGAVRMQSHEETPTRPESAMTSTSLSSGLDRRRRDVLRRTVGFGRPGQHRADMPHDRSGHRPQPVGCPWPRPGRLRVSSAPETAHVSSRRNRSTRSAGSDPSAAIGRCRDEADVHGRASTRPCAAHPPAAAGTCVRLTMGTPWFGLRPAERRGSSQVEDQP